MQSWSRQTECIFCHFRHHIKHTRTTFRYQAIHSASSVRQNNSIDHQVIHNHTIQNEVLKASSSLNPKKAQFAGLGNDRTFLIKTRVKSSLSRLGSEADDVAWTKCRRQFDPDGTLWQDFSKQLYELMDLDEPQKRTNAKEDSTGLVADLERANKNLTWKTAIDQRLKFAFIDYVLYQDEGLKKYSNAATFDLKYPTEWYSDTRCIQRDIHLHVGPTNSGKTYTALKKLETAGNGFYAGPLRLLAHEVFSRFNNRGVKCNLITGDDIRLDTERVDLYASTVEMVNLNKVSDVGVIDEIQMISSPDRGFAWTRALLGAKVKELHLCGEARVVPLIRQLVASMGDTLHVHKYERLNPLKVMSRSLRGNLKNLRRGDCLVCFSVVNLHAMKKQIERETGKRVAIVYGSLPPETRAQQAALFNDPNNDYDYLVASDAIGMGLNLSIKRVVFESTIKFNGLFRERLTIPTLKQIAGRAGRFKTSNDDAKLGKDKKPTDKPGVNVGLITCLDEADLPYIQKAMTTEAPPIRKAGLTPPTEVYEDCAALFPEGTPFAYIMHHVHRMVSLNPRFELCDDRDQLSIAELLDRFPDLDVSQRVTFCSSPAKIRGQGLGGTDQNSVILELAQVVAERRVVTVADIESIPLETLEIQMSSDKVYLEQLEFLHKTLNLYLWLHYRFEQIITDKDMAERAKYLTEERINTYLAKYSANPKVRAHLKKIKQAWSPVSPTLRRRLMKENLFQSPTHGSVNGPVKQSNKVVATDSDVITDFLNRESQSGEHDRPRSQS